MAETNKKYHIEKNTVQETLVIPLYGRKVCSEHFPKLFKDKEAERICSMLDYDFAEKGKKMESTAGLFGALEVAQRQYDLAWEVKDYLKNHPRAAVVNLGCGLDDTFRKCDNGTCKGYNIDISDVNALFSMEDKSELERWSKNFASVTERSYMRGYRDIYKDVSTTHKLMIKFCDSMVKMKIIKIVFRSVNQNEKVI